MAYQLLLPLLGLLDDARDRGVVERRAAAASFRRRAAALGVRVACRGASQSIPRE